jgi:hypothetical protein
VVILKAKNHSEENSFGKIILKSVIKKQEAWPSFVWHRTWVVLLEPDTTFDIRIYRLQFEPVLQQEKSSLVINCRRSTEELRPRQRFPERSVLTGSAHCLFISDDNFTVPNSLRSIPI